MVLGPEFNWLHGNMAFEPGSEFEGGDKLRMVWIAQRRKTMDALERRRAKWVAREVEVRRFGAGCSGAGVGGVGVGRRVGGGGVARGVERGTILVNDGFGDYALRVAPNKDETGIRVRTISAWG